MEEKRLEFYGGVWVSFLPFLIFVGITLTFLVLGAPDVRGMWIASMAGIMITFFMAKDKINYANVIVKGMGEPGAIVPVACFIFAGLFASVLRSSKLVEGVIWLAYKMGATGTMFIIITFLVSAMFATAAGTGFGTIVAGMSVLYPAGVILGANPILLIGTIIGGGAFGDNLAPVSDTTICSAASQGVEVGGVVRSRLKYSLAAAIITILFIILLGGTGQVADVSIEVVEQYMNPRGLVMLIPAAITILVAMKKGDVIYATTCGTVLSVIFALVFGLNTVSNLITIDNGTISGVMVDGIAGMIDLSVLVMLIMACVKILQASGGDVKILDSLGRFINSKRKAEGAITVMSIVISAIMTVNSAAILTVGTSFAKPLADKFKLNPYRVANLLDGAAIAVTYYLPYISTVLVASTMSIQAREQFGDLIPCFTSSQITPHIVYPLALLAVLVVAIITGWGNDDNLQKNIK